ncbi:DDE-type integrase/transposase/recombinase [Noviherbaspirillum sp. Root189]|uniref:DDE-type integrase/transposase/recombinase n=1 Tax=Noviherbaspirillum sp. Root189 TaxID=1736487 RepID=UPI0007103837|nr:DDE-type integrase/transposase/recombinase [Noviherbaspirillum sp. Root189]KRB75752.1 integrase [Noviherbaspirillum sp. Root189]
MNRRRCDFLQIDLSTWPAVDHHALPIDKRKAFMARAKAVELYVCGTTLREIATQTGIQSRQLYWLLDRCLKPAEDGQIFGFRALLKSRHVEPYTRKSDFMVDNVGTRAGFAGAFAMLLERYPILATWLETKIDQRAVVLEQISTDGKLKTRLRNLTNLHTGFIQQCRKVGITGADYPLNTGHKGMRSLSAYLKSELLSKFGTAARAAGAEHVKGVPHTDFSPRRGPARPYQIVEFDGHRLDVRLKIVIRDPLGFDQEVEIERIWLLVLIDVCTRAVLGYNLVLSREYSRYDVIKTIENALTPHVRRAFTLPNVGYGMHGDFPSGRLPELGYAVWERVRLDNAKANLAEDTVSALCEFIGCAVDAGPPHQPNDRPYIERFFGTVASTLSSRLPGYTGSSPQDVRRALCSPKGNLRLFISLSEMEELMEASIANYNATPHGGLNGRSPLEAMEYFIRGKGHLISWLPEPKRRTLCLMQKARRCRVRGYLAQGTRAHINLFQVRYTNVNLATSGDLFGKDLRIYYNSDDLRTVRAFLPDGSELGVLKAQGLWGEITHDLKLRREILKKRDSKRLEFRLDHDFLEGFMQEKRAKAKTSRRAANDFERTARVLSSAPTHFSEAGPASDTQLRPGPEDLLLQHQGTDTPEEKRDSSQKPKAEVLTIGFGYTTSI